MRLNPLRRTVQKTICIFILCSEVCALAGATPLVFSPANDAVILNNEQALKVVQPIVNMSRFNFLGPAGHTGERSVNLSTQIIAGGVSDQSRQIANKTFEGGSEWPTTVLLPSILVTLGLPSAFDIGARVGWIPYSKLYSYGFGVQATLVDGAAPAPVVSARFGVSFLKDSGAGIAVINATTYNVEILAGTHMPNIDPYIGFGGSVYENISCFKYIAENLDYTTKWNDMYLTLGAQIRPLPYLSTGLELQLSSIQSMLGLSLGLALF